MTEPCYWRLEYADAQTMDEALEGSSVLAARPGALRLTLTRPLFGHDDQRVPIVSIDLVAEGHAWRPIFYRQRSASLEDGPGVGRLDATVIGRGRETDETVELKLFVLPGGKHLLEPSSLLNAEERHIDRNYIQLAVLGKVADASQSASSII